MRTNEKKLLIGTLMLTIFGFFCKALGAVFKIGLTSIVGSYGMGLYQLLFPVLVFFIVFSSEGYATALTVKMAENKEQGRAYFRLSIVLTFISSLISFVLINLVCSKLLDIETQGIDSLFYLVIGVSVVIISILSINKARIRGFERFVAYSLFEALEDFLKVIFAIILALILSSVGVTSAILGVFIGIALSALITLVCLVIYKPSKTNFEYIKLSDKERVGFIKFSFLTMASIIVIPAIQFIESGIIVDLLGKTGISEVSATKLYGISRGSVSAIINLPFFIVGAMEVLLLPNLSRSKNKGVYFKKTELSLIFAVGVSMPFVLGFSMFSSEAVSILYGKALSEQELLIASNLLRLGAVGIIFSSIASFLVIILNSNNKTCAPLIANIVAGVLKLIFIILLTPMISIYAVELSSVLFSMLVCLINLIFAIKYKVIKRPKLILPVGVVWILIFIIIRAFYNLIKPMLSSSFLALVISSLSVFVVIAGLCIMVYFIMKNKNRKHIV